MTLMRKNYVIKEKLNDIICQSSSDYKILDNAYNYIEKLEQQCKKQKEVIYNIKKCFDDGRFEDGCDCLIIEKYIDNYLEEVSE